MSRSTCASNACARTLSRRATGWAIGIRVRDRPGQDAHRDTQRLAPSLQRLSIERELQSAAAALAPATRRAYERDWRVFAGWCVARGLRLCLPRPRRSPRSWPPRPTASSARSRSPSAPPGSPSRTARRTSPTPCDSPAIAAVVAGIRRERGVRALRKSPAARARAARAAARADRHLDGGWSSRPGDTLLLGFAAALRRSELVALDVEHLTFDAARGCWCWLPRSKADQEQEGPPGRGPLRPGARPLCGPGAAPLP
jgi:hypothetical protein